MRDTHTEKDTRKERANNPWLDENERERDREEGGRDTCTANQVREQ